MSDTRLVRVRETGEIKNTGDPGIGIVLPPSKMGIQVVYYPAESSLNAATIDRAKVEELLRDVTNKAMELEARDNNAGITDTATLRAELDISHSALLSYLFGKEKA